MSELLYKITIVEAIVIAKEIQKALEGTWTHVALGGSCLHNGGSNKDIDLVIMPHNTQKRTPTSEVIKSLEIICGIPLVERDHSEYNDDKEVWKGIYKGIVVDFFFLE